MAGAVATAVGANMGFCVWVSLIELRIDYEGTTGWAEGGRGMGGVGGRAFV